MRNKNQGPNFKGHNSHIHITVTSSQRALVLANARKAKQSISVYMRGVIDNLEVSK